MLRIPTLVALGLAPLACASSQASSEPTAPQAEAPAAKSTSEDKPVGTKLMRDVNDSEDTYVVGPNEGQGLGEYAVSFNGKPVWPPQGDGCQPLIACCTELAALSNALAISCLLATARDRDCNVAKQTAVAIAGEQFVSVPDSCK